MGMAKKEKKIKNKYLFYRGSDPWIWGPQGVLSYIQKGDRIINTILFLNTFPYFQKCYIIYVLLFNQIKKKSENVILKSRQPIWNFCQEYFRIYPQTSDSS